VARRRATQFIATILHKWIFHPSAIANANHTLMCVWDYYYQAQRRYEAAYAKWQQQAGRSD
jgi:hypothetical protein